MTFDSLEHTTHGNGRTKCQRVILVHNCSMNIYRVLVEDASCEYFEFVYIVWCENEQYRMLYNSICNLQLIASSFNIKKYISELVQH